MNIYIFISYNDINTTYDYEILIKLYDQGKGIPLDQSEKIFTRFYTDREEDKEKHTGLGLAIVKDIIYTFKGSIKLSKSDKLTYPGACFVVKLPLKIVKKNQ